MQPIVWMGSSREDLVDFTADARRDAGYQLDKLQRGQEPDDWKPMTSVGVGVREVRIRESSGAFRVVYLASHADRIYVLHAFRKTTEKTSRTDIELARRRFRSIRELS